MSVDQGVNVMSNDKTMVYQGLGYDKQAVMPYRTTKGAQASKQIKSANITWAFLALMSTMVHMLWLEHL